MFVYYNANPKGRLVGDCAVRALSVVFNDTWRHIYADLTMMGYYAYDMPNSNAIIAEYLTMNGFSYYDIPNTYSDYYTIREFARDHSIGTYVLATGSHVVALIDGYYIDTADCGDELPIYYFRKEID